MLNVKVNMFYIIKMCKNVVFMWKKKIIVIKLNFKFDFLNLLMFYGVNIGSSIEVILLLISFIRFDLV